MPVGAWTSALLDEAPPSTLHSAKLLAELSARAEFLAERLELGDVACCIRV